MKKLCVIGDPVGHSLSPRIHRCMIANTGVDYSYDVHPVRREELANFVAEARSGAYAGFNVTMPHKKAILPLLDELTEEAVRCGAVNTVRVEDGHTIGHNTDGQGFLDSLAAGTFQPKGKTALLLGAGGAAEAVAAALIHSGVKKLILCNRSVQRAQELAVHYPMQAEGVPFEETSLHRAAAACDLLINATPLGMAGNEEFPDLRFLEEARPHTVVYDLVYHPQETALLREVRRRGLATVGGMELLIHQAMLSFSFFTGKTVEQEKMKEQIKKALAE